MSLITVLFVCLFVCFLEGNVDFLGKQILETTV